MNIPADDKGLINEVDIDYLDEATQEMILIDAAVNELKTREPELFLWLKRQQQAHQRFIDVPKSKREINFRKILLKVGALVYQVTRQAHVLDEVEKIKSQFCEFPEDPILPGLYPEEELYGEEENNEEDGCEEE